MHDLSVPQFRTLAYIARHPGCSLSDVAEFIGLTLPSMSVLINGLVEQGLVLRQTSLIDRRRVTLTLTEAGSEVYQRARQGTLAWLQRLLEPLSEEERQTIVRAMELLKPIFVAEMIHQKSKQLVEESTGT
ncbi:MarR family winged helix-turn-helix transcriptional regulator [Caldilinea sp.]|uniref:MarR family winged helix-turn-helix transcriptional regulator n=1 Tax=Caldilinea sp. TaxID=2293560 RepID=UPI002625E5F9|nr:MarR family transcriptional regulator [uncultured Caldilinea sp.]